MAEQDTVTPTETVAAPVTSNDATTTAQGAVVNGTSELEARLAEAEKARQQAEMRARQLENQRQEEERKRQEEQGEYQKLYEAEKARAAELEQQRQMDELMAGYDPNIQAVAKKLFGAGDLPSQMAALQEAIKQTAPAKAEEEAPQPKVEAMNPNPREVGAQQSILKEEMSLDEMAEALEKRLKGAGL